MEISRTIPHIMRIKLVNQNWYKWLIRASLVTQTVKCLPAMRDTQVQSLGRKDPLEKEMTTHSSTLACKIPWMEEPCRLQSMGSLRVGHDWPTSLSRLTFMHWRRKWQPTPVLLPRKFHGWRSLVGYSPWGCKESDTTEQLHHHQGRVDIQGIALIGLSHRDLVS